MSVTLRIIWRTQHDSKVCPTCKALEGYTWILKAGESYPKKLIHPTYGPVFDTRMPLGGSLIKEEDGHLCRCIIVEQFDVSNMIANNNNGDVCANKYGDKTKTSLATKP
jgi:hypothetical protein